MKKEYDFSKGTRKNPYFKSLTKQITINLSNEVIDYFKKLSEETKIPYQTLINFCLINFVKNKRTITVDWE